MYSAFLGLMFFPCCLQRKRCGITLVPKNFNALSRSKIRPLLGSFRNRILQGFYRLLAILILWNHVISKL